jgi:hypothetical protein
MSSLMVMVMVRDTWPGSPGWPKWLALPTKINCNDAGK